MNNETALTPIVVVAYNRPNSLKRLLISLAKASYPSKDVQLIISIDKAEEPKGVPEIAEDFLWEHGAKKIIKHKANLGLRKHVTQCASFSKEYGSVIVLEDDLFVSPYFYEFAQEAILFSSDKSYIGGISLYAHQFNVHTRSNFSPIQDGYDNWYFQFASSWGQVWTKDQWVHFDTWYFQNETLKDTHLLPSNVARWSNKSWLKYYITYLIEFNRYFLYPKVSFTTNFSDAGTHIGQDSTLYQVPLALGSKKSGYHFSELNTSNAVYDAFYENTKIAKFLNLEKKSLCVNLNGKRRNFQDKKYVISDDVLHYKVIQSYGRSLKPIDLNIFCEIPGNDIFLYDTEIKEKNPVKYDQFRKLIYIFKEISFKDARFLSIQLFKNRVQNILNKIF